MKILSQLFKKKCVVFIFIVFLMSTIYGQVNNKKNILWTTAWSPNGKYIAVGGNQGDLKFFDGKTFQLIKTYPVKDVILSRLKWHPTRNLLAVVTQNHNIVARILDVELGVWIDLQDLESSSRGVDWNKTGELLAVSEFEGEVSVFTPDGKRISRFMADPKSVTDLDWHPTKDIMVTVGSQIGIYNTFGDTISNFKSRIEKILLLCVEWHISGKFFVVGDYGVTENPVNDKDKSLQFWNVKGEKLFEIEGRSAEYRNIRWNPDGERLASASDALRIWSIEAKLLYESKSTEDYLWGVDWSPDGKYLVTSSKLGKIKIWDNKANFIRELDY